MAMRPLSSPDEAKRYLELGARPRARRLAEGWADLEPSPAARRPRRRSFTWNPIAALRQWITEEVDRAVARNRIDVDDPLRVAAEQRAVMYAQLQQGTRLCADDVIIGR